MVNKNTEHSDDETVVFTNDNTDLNLDMDETEVEELSAAKVKKLRHQLQAAEDAKRQALEDLARERADFLNARKRLNEQQQSDAQRSSIRHIETLLPLCDSFDMAMRDNAWQAADSSWRKGVEGIYGQLTGILRSYGVEEISALGSHFDPLQHEALSDRNTNDIVAEVLQKGYRLGSTIIRPAKVVVGTDVA